MFDRKIFYPFVIIGVDAARSNDIKIKIPLILLM